KSNSRSENYHSVLHFWEKKLSPYMEEIINMVLKKLHILTYSKSFIDSTIIRNRKKKKGLKYM
ncbi:hypothetical protein KKP97_05450, partial [Methanothermococcus sp. SCGC AD-155-C09]|nr:hypothetical protein [Methanothermococcus sp. SCGC AD-155-C09]